MTVKTDRRPGNCVRDSSLNPDPQVKPDIGGNKHRWFQDNRYYDLIVILDDATSEIYYAQLVEAVGGRGSTRTVMAALGEVIERKAGSVRCTATAAATSS